MMKTMIAALALAGAAPAAWAQTAGDEGRFSVGVTAGTLGVGPEAGYRLSHSFGIRANATFLSFHHGFNSDDVDYGGSVHLKSGGAMLDLYPFGGGFRISAGARINGTHAKVVATPTSPTEIGDTIYTPAQIGTITGRADTRNFAPAVTLGYGGKLRKGLTLGIEAGALFEGAIRIKDFTSSTGLIPAADLERERRSIQDDVNDYKVYPILQLRLAYRF